MGGETDSAWTRETHRGLFMRVRPWKEVYKAGRNSRHR